MFLGRLLLFQFHRCHMKIIIVSTSQRIASGTHVIHSKDIEFMVHYLLKSSKHVSYYLYAKLLAIILRLSEVHYKNANLV